VAIPEGESLVAWPRLELFVPSLHLGGDASVHSYDSSTASWLVSDFGLPDFLSERWLQAGTAFWVTVRQEASLDPSAADAYDVLYYHADHLGSINVASRVDGALVEEIVYYPFGYPRIQSAFDMAEPPVVDYVFAGKEHDSESDLYYFEARYLLSAVGRFGSTDPFRSDNGSRPEWPQSLNLYAYSSNAPTVLVDPTGLAEVTTDAVDDTSVSGSDDSPLASKELESVSADLLAPMTPVLGFDPEKMADFVYENAASSFSVPLERNCAQKLREGFEAAGQGMKGHPRAAKDYVFFLPEIGWIEVTGMSVLKNDIKIFQGGQYGHIQSFTGQGVSGWTSNYRQNNDVPPSQKGAQFSVWRYEPALTSTPLWNLWR